LKYLPHLSDYLSKDSNMDSATIIYMAQEQNEEIDEAVRSQGGRLLRFIRGRVRSEEDADDVFQDVLSQFVEAYRRLERIEQVGAWLFRVARNKIADLYRKRKPTPASELADAPYLLEILPDITQEPEDGLMQEMIWDAIREAVEELPSAQREVFTWHEFDGLTFKEMAEITGDSENALRLRKYQAVQKLRKRLRDLYQEL